MNAYAILHKPSGAFMPTRMYRTSAAGWSHWEPVNAPYPPHDANPRLFFTKTGARNALAMWLQGVWQKGMTSGNYFEPPEETCLAPYEPRTPRKREDMQIVTFELRRID